MSEHRPAVLHGERDFEWRGRDISRLEGFSDAVFAFAVTLLVVSLEVPKTFHELMDAMRGFGAFAVCFALLANVWFQHYKFFRRYALQSTWAVFLNCVLLFCVLFYVYPLKFLFAEAFAGHGGIGSGEVRVLFVIYGLGYATVFLVLALLYVHAWRLRRELQLSTMEQLKTRRTLVNQLAMTAIGLISAGLALVLPGHLIGLAGYFYFSVGVYFFVAGWLFGKREMRARLAISSARPRSAEQRAS